LPIADLVHTLPGLVLLGLLPGLLVARAIAPALSRAERLAMAPGLSCGALGLVGVAEHDLHVPFELATMLPFLAVVWLIGRRRARSTPEEPRNAVPASVVAAALLAGAVVVLTAVVTLRNEPLPVWNDPAVHGQVAAEIQRTHDVLPVIPVPADGTGFVRPHMGYEATVALIATVDHISPARALNAPVVLSLLLLPLGVALLTLRVTGSDRAAALAPLLAVGLVFPASPMTFGAFPFIVDSTLVVPLVLAVWRLVEGERSGSPALMAGVLTAAIWVNHGLELPTAAVVATPLVLARLAGTARGQAVRGVLAAGVAVGAGAAVAWLLTRVPIYRVGQPINGPDNVATDLAGHSGATLGDAARELIQSQMTGLTIVLAFAGIAAAVLLRRARWTLVVLAAIVLIVDDVLGAERLHRLWSEVYPWSTVDRVYGMSFWVLPLLMAFGLVWLATIVRPRMGAGVIRRLGPVALLAVIAPALYHGVDHDHAVLADNARAHSRVTDADIQVLEAMDGALPAGSRVLTNGESDAGIWVGSLTGLSLIQPKQYATDHPDDPRVVALSRACDDPAAARAALVDADAVFVGAATPADAEHHWDARCIGRLAGLRLISSATGGGAAAQAFAVIR
jgi:hypothetical protein